MSAEETRQGLQRAVQDAIEKRRRAVAYKASGGRMLLQGGVLVPESIATGAAPARERMRLVGGVLVPESIATGAASRKQQVTKLSMAPARERGAIAPRAPNNY
jgi:hypothetical protein